MNKHQASGIGKQIKGGVKAATSSATGNTAGKAEGKIQKAIGKTQTALGNEMERQKRERRARA